jgi:hypothetical protein
VPRLLVEAKALGENLEDRRWAQQILVYASVAGVEWVVLTNGVEYSIYNTHADVPIEEKLFRTVRVPDDGPCTVEALSLLSRKHVQDRRIGQAWGAEIADRQVESALRHLLSMVDPDPSLIQLIDKLASWA